MDKAKPIKTFMGTNSHLDLDMSGKLVDQKVYRSMIGSFLYLCASRPDIMLSVYMCARFQAAPKECHLRAVKRIMRYLVLTPYVGLWYPESQLAPRELYWTMKWLPSTILGTSTTLAQLMVCFPSTTSSTTSSATLSLRSAVTAPTSRAQQGTFY
jgi:hypothetical protein